MSEVCSYDSQVELPTIYLVSKVVLEGKGLKSIFLNGKITCKPGQFVMVWIPGVEEKPMAVSYVGKNEFAFCYHTVGPFTKACDKLIKGSKVGIRGPYGKSFTIKKNSVVVGGGVGMSSVSTLIDALSKPIVINGARDKDHVIYQKRFKDMIICTDDGSLGRKGYTTDALGEVLKSKKISMVYTCGPEIMMKKIVSLCNKHNVSCEASIERYMKCGFGICGNCLVDDKILCMEGPIFDRKQLNSLKEFGETARLKTGKRVNLKDYYAWRNHGTRS